MFNIVKSQNYQIRHDMFSVITVIVILGISVYMALCESVTGAEKFLALGENIPMLWLLICLVMGARIAAWDYSDKTINYELLAGHSRKDLYWGRFVVALWWCVLLCLGTVGIPLIICSVRNGWGNNVDFVNCMLRLLVSVLPLLRILAEFFLLAILLKNCYVTYAVGYVLIGGTMMGVLLLSEVLNVDCSFLLGFTTLAELFQLGNSHLEWIDGVDISVYDSILSSSQIMEIILSSIVVILLSLFAGYGVFKKRDME